MNLGEIKKKALALIEELDTDNTTLTADEDIQKKLNYIVNQVQNELARFKKIPAKQSVEITENELEYDLNKLDLFYQVQVIRGLEAEIFGTTADFKETGKADIYYYKYPTQIDAETPDTQELDLTIDVLEIMPYGIAADLLKSDVSNAYGNVYASRYQEMIQALDPRHSLGSIYIDTVEV
jgi:hypothetical protein